MNNKKLSKFLLNCFFILTISWLNLFFYYPSFAKTDISSALNFRSGEFLVKFKGNQEIHRILVDKNVNILEIIEKYQQDSEIEYIEPNYLFEAAAFPNDPQYFEQWYLRTVNAQQAWSKELVTREQGKITRESVIAILDTGVDLDHPDLADKIWANSKEVAGDKIDNDKNGYIDDVSGWDFVFDDNDSNPSFDAGYNKEAVNHGTIVAGIAAAASHNNQGITGLGWFSRIMSLRVLDSQGLGDVYDVVRAIDYAVTKGADVINMSFIGSNYSSILAETIKKAYNQNILIVAAAGNTDPKINGFNLDLVKVYPVCYDGSSGENMVIGVASIGKNLKKSTFSNYGGCVDLAAPGESFYSTQVYYPTDSGLEKYYDGYWSGTSLSAPLVSGTFGLIKALRPNFSVLEIKEFVLQSTKNIDDYNPEYKGKLGTGQLDVLKAVETALGQKPLVKKGEKNYIVAGLGLGSFPQVKVLKEDGSIFKAFYAYSPHFTGAINVAVGDVNGDGKDEIITGAGYGGGPHIRIFNIEGQVLSQFFAYDKDFRGGVNLAVGDINGDGVKEIITGIGWGGEPEIKVFNYQGELINKFYAYSKDFLGGVKVAAGDVNKDGRDDIVAGAGAGGGPHVRIFNSDSSLISQFFAYNQNFKGGVNVAVGDLHGDGQPEIIASIENNSLPTVRVFSYQGVKLLDFFAYPPNFLEGVYVSSGDFDNDGIEDIITGAGIGGGPHIKIFNLYGRLKLELFAHYSNYSGGVRSAILRY